MLATGPNEVWSWDITKLKGAEKWTYYYLYVILDIYSRNVVGWMLAHRESSDLEPVRKLPRQPLLAVAWVGFSDRLLAKELIESTIEKQEVSAGQLIILSDRGPSMTSHNVAHLLGSLGVTKSHSRPQVSNDNPFSESQFKTMKYRPDFPQRFGSYEDALAFCRRFFDWYNNEHYHSGIGMLTPSSLHYGKAEEILASRQQTLLSAWSKTPERFVGGVPKRQRLPNAVWINPPKKETEKKDGAPAVHCTEAPEETSLTHPRSGYPLDARNLRMVASPQSHLPFHRTTQR